ALRHGRQARKLLSVQSQSSLYRGPGHELEVLRMRRILAVLSHEQPLRELRSEVAGDELDAVGFLDRAEWAPGDAEAAHRRQRGQAEHREGVVTLARGDQP